MTKLPACPPVRPSACPSAGFTLVEVLVSLVVAGSAALLAHGIFSAAVSGSADLRIARSSIDRTANGHRFLESALLSLDIGNGEGNGFAGQRGQARFAAWLQSPEGWFERRELVLAHEQSRLVVAIWDDADCPPVRPSACPPVSPIVLTDSVAVVELDYLLQPGADSRWVQEWISPVSAPLALRLRITRHGGDGQAGIVDTSTYLIKARG